MIPDATFKKTFSQKIQCRHILEQSCGKCFSNTRLRDEKRWKRFSYQLLYFASVFNFFKTLLIVIAMCFFDTFFRTPYITLRNRQIIINCIFIEVKSVPFLIEIYVKNLYAAVGYTCLDDCKNYFASPRRVKVIPFCL